MTASFTRTRMTWLAYILLSLYGYFLNILGPITPFLKDEFGLSYTVSSLHFSAFAVGILLVGLGGHVLIRRVGRVRALSIGALGLGLGALLLVAGRAPAITIGAAFLMGCVGSLILAVVPAALSEEHGALRAVAISESNVLASLLSTAAPLLVGWLAGQAAGWRLALIAAALLALLIGLVLLRQPARRAAVDASQPGRRLPLQFWYYWVVLVLAVSVEFCMVYWSADYLGSVLGVPVASAAQAVSLFLAGMIIGRLVGGQAVRRFAPRSVILASLLLGSAGFLLFWTTASPALGMAGLAVTGLGVASLYPLVLALAIGASGGDESQAGARTTLASGTAILALPLVLGRVADIVGLKAAFAVVAVLFAGILVLMVARGWIMRGDRVSEAEQT